MATSKKKDRKTTILGVLINMTEQMKQEVDQFMFDYSFMFRFSFKRLVEIEREHGLDEDRKKAIQQLEKDVSSRTGYPIRVAKDAVADANELLTARHTLMVEYHELWKERYENTKAKYEKLKQNPNVNHRSFHMLGLQNKMERQLKHIQFYAQHILQHTFPSVVFGGRKNFEELQKGNLSKEKWNELRNGRMSSRGDATKGGNPNLHIMETIIWELSHQVVWPCVEQKLALVMEDLAFIHSKDVSKKVRRTSHQSCGHTSSKGDKKLLVPCVTITFGKFFEPGCFNHSHSSVAVRLANGG